MVKLARLITNKRAFIAFYTLSILYDITLLRILIPYFYEYHFSVFEQVYTLWATVIVLDDLIHKRILNNKYKILFELLFTAALGSMIFQSGPHDLTQVKYLISYGVMVYIFTSGSLSCSRKQFRNFLVFLSVNTVVLIFFMNAASFWQYNVSAPSSDIFRNLLKSFSGLFSARNNLSGFVTHIDDRYAGYYLSVGYASFSQYLSIVLSLYLFDQLCHNWVAKVIGSLLVLINAVLALWMLGMSDARVVFLDIILIVICLIAIGIKRITKVQWIGVIITLGLSAISLFSIERYFVPVLKQEIATSGMDNYQFWNKLLSHRLDYWAAGWTDFLKRPIFGNGWMKSDTLGETFSVARIYLNHHNLFINLLCWTGFIGTGIFVLVITLCTIRIFKNGRYIAKSKSEWLIVLCLCVFIQSMLDICIIGEDLHIETPWFWLCFGYLVFLYKKKPAE